MTVDLLKQILEELRKQTSLLSALANGMPLQKGGGSSGERSQRSNDDGEPLIIPQEVEHVTCPLKGHKGKALSSIPGGYLRWIITDVDLRVNEFGDAIRIIAKANGLQTKGQKAHAANLKAGVPPPAFEQPAQNAAASNAQPPSDTFDDDIPF